MFDLFGIRRRQEERRQREDEANLRAAWVSRNVAPDRLPFGDDVVRRYQERHRLYPKGDAPARSSDDGWSNSPVNPVSPSGMLLSPLSSFSPSFSSSDTSSSCSSSSYDSGSSSSDSSSSCGGGSD